MRFNEAHAITSWPKQICRDEGDTLRSTIAENRSSVWVDEPRASGFLATISSQTADGLLELLSKL